MCETALFGAIRRWPPEGCGAGSSCAEAPICRREQVFSSATTRSTQSTEGNPGERFQWEVALDFASVPIGETVDLTIDIMHAEPADDERLAEMEWWRFEVDANPEIATSWILLPRDKPHAEFSVVRWRNDNSEVIELVKPTHQTRMYDGAVIHWSVVHPEPGYTYSSRWSYDEEVP
jgi:hypothetical protein